MVVPWMQGSFNDKQCSMIVDILDLSVSYIEIWEFDVSMIFITGFRSYVYSAMSIITMNFNLHMLLLPVRLILQISTLFVISTGLQKCEPCEIRLYNL